MVLASQGACAAMCLRVDAVLSTECAEEVAAALTENMYTPYEDATAAIARYCTHLSVASGVGTPPPPTPPTRPASAAAQRYNTYLHIKTYILLGCELLSFALACVATWSWDDFQASRRHSLLSYLLLTCAPFVVAVLPWYSVLGFAEAIEQDHASTGGNVDMAAFDALAMALMAKDELLYKSKLALDVGG